MNPVFAAGALIAVGAALIPVGYKYVYQPLFASNSGAISDSGGRYDVVAQQDDDESLSIQTKVEINRTDTAYDYQQLTSEAPASHYGHFDRSKYNQTPQSPAGETFLQVGAPGVQRSPYSPVHHDQVALEDVIQQALTKQKQASPSSPAPQKAPKINEQYITSYQQYTPSIVSNTSVTVSSSSTSFQPAPLPEEDEEQIEIVEATVVSEVVDEEPNIGKFVLAAKQEQIQRALETSQELSVVEEVEIVEEVNLSKFQDSEAQEPAPVQEATVEAVEPSESSILDKFGNNETTETSESKEEAPAEDINLDKFGSQEQSAPQPAVVEETPAVETAEPVTEAPATEEVDISKFVQEETQPAVVAEEPKPAEVAVEEVQPEPVDISKFSEEAVPATETAPAEATQVAQEPAQPEEEQAEEEAEVSNPVPSSSQQKKKKKNKKNNKKR